MRFNKSLHGLRGVASLMVVIAHVTFGFHEHIYPGSVLLARLATWVANFGTYGVELFFVISGYVITASCRRYTPLEFAGRRFMRLYPVFLMFTLIYFILNMTTHYEVAKLGIAPLLSNLVFIDLFIGTPALTPNAWSISFEVWYYISTYGLVWFVMRSESQYRIIGAMVFLTLAGFMLATFDITIYFAGGALLYALHERIGPKISPRASALQSFAALAVIVVIATTLDFPPRTYLEMPGRILPAVALVAATLIFVQAVLFGSGPISRLLCTAPVRFLGTISYSLYLTHPYVYMLARQVIVRSGVNAYPWPLIYPAYLLATVALALVLSWVVHKIVEVGPYQLAYGRRIYRDPQPADPTEEVLARQEARA